MHFASNSVQNELQERKHPSVCVLFKKSPAGMGRGMILSGILAITAIDNQHRYYRDRQISIRVAIRHLHIEIIRGDPNKTYRHAHKHTSSQAYMQALR